MGTRFLLHDVLVAHDCLSVPGVSMDVGGEEKLQLDLTDESVAFVDGDAGGDGRALCGAAIVIMA